MSKLIRKVIIDDFSPAEVKYKAYDFLKGFNASEEEAEYISSLFADVQAEDHRYEEDNFFCSELIRVLKRVRQLKIFDRED